MLELWLFQTFVQTPLCKLEKLKFWECVDLARLDLSHNLLTTIPQAMAQNTSLTALKLSHNRLASSDQLAAVFGLASLATLDLSSNQIRGALPYELATAA